MRHHVYTTLNVPSIPCSDGGNSSHFALFGPGGECCCMPCLLVTIVDVRTHSADASALLCGLVELVRDDPSLLAHARVDLHEWLTALLVVTRLHRSDSGCAEALSLFLALALELDAPFILRSFHDTISSRHVSDEVKSVVFVLLSDMIAAPHEQAAANDPQVNTTQSLLQAALSGGCGGGSDFIEEGPTLVSAIIELTAAFLSSPDLLLGEDTRPALKQADAPAYGLQSTEEERSTSSQSFSSSGKNTEQTRRGLVALACFLSLQLIQSGGLATINSSHSTEQAQQLVRSCARAARRFHMLPCDITANALALILAVTAQPALHCGPAGGAQARSLLQPFMISGEDSLSGTMRDETSQCSELSTTAAQEEQRVTTLKEVFECLTPLMLSTSDTIAATVSSVLGRLVSAGWIDISASTEMPQKLLDHACEALRTCGQRTSCTSVFELASMCFSKVLQSRQHSSNHLDAARDCLTPSLGLYLIDLMETDASYFVDTVLPSELFSASMSLCDVHDIAARVMHLLKQPGVTTHSAAVLLDVVAKHPDSTTLSETTVQLLAHNTRYVLLDALLQGASAAVTDDSGQGVESDERESRRNALRAMGALSYLMQLRVCQIVLWFSSMTPAMDDWCQHVYHHLRVVTRAEVGPQVSCRGEDCTRGVPLELPHSALSCNSAFFPLLVSVASYLSTMALHRRHTDALLSVANQLLLTDLLHFGVQILSSCGGAGATAQEAKQLLEGIVNDLLRGHSERYGGSDAYSPVLSIPVQQVFSVGMRCRPLSFTALTEQLLAFDVANGVPALLVCIRLSPEVALLGSASRHGLIPPVPSLVKALAQVQLRDCGLLLGPDPKDLALWLLYALFVLQELQSSDHVIAMMLPAGEDNNTTFDSQEMFSPTPGAFMLLWMLMHECAANVSSSSDNGATTRTAMCDLVRFIGCLGSLFVSASGHAASGHDSDRHHQRSFSYPLRLGRQAQLFSDLFAGSVLHSLLLLGHHVAFVADLSQRISCATQARPDHDDVALLLTSICRKSFTPTLQFSPTDSVRRHCSDEAIRALGDAVLCFLAGCQEQSPDVVSILLGEDYLGPFLLSAARDEVITASMHRVDTIARLLLPCIALPRDTRNHQCPTRSCDAAVAAKTMPPSSNSKRVVFLRVFSRWALHALEYHLAAFATSWRDCPVARVLSACIELGCGDEVCSHVVRMFADLGGDGSTAAQPRTFDVLQLLLTVHHTLKCSESKALLHDAVSLTGILARFVCKQPNDCRAPAPLECEGTSELIVSLEKAAGLCGSFYSIVMDAGCAATNADVITMLGFAVEVYLQVSSSSPTRLSPVCLHLCALVLEHRPALVHLPVVLALILHLSRFGDHVCGESTPIDAVTASSLRRILKVATSTRPQWSSTSRIGCLAIDQFSVVCDQLDINGAIRQTSSQLTTFCGVSFGVPLEFFLAIRST